MLCGVDVTVESFYFNFILLILFLKKKITILINIKEFDSVIFFFLLLFFESWVSSAQITELCPLSRQRYSTNWRFASRSVHYLAMVD